MVEKYVLENGIPVFVVASDASPVVSIQAWVSRGSAHEKDTVAGISHFLEHALFKGTRKRQVGEIASEIESLGGEINAFTSFEETAYYTTLSSRHFKEGLDVIADAIQNPLFDKNEMEREKEVILEEIRRAQDSPYKMVATNLWKESFPNTPYGRPVLGFEQTVSRIDHKLLKEYFSRNYHTGTTSLVIVGDVEPKQALVLCRQKLKGMKQGKQEKPLKPIHLPSPSRPRLIPLGRDINECHLQMAVLAPPIRDTRIPTLDLMCSAVGQGESSRLYQKLVKQTKLALDVHMGLVATGRCGLATIGMTVAPENLQAALQQCFATLREAANEGLEEPELERVKSSLESEVVGGKETVDGYARRLGYYYVHFGEPDYEKKYLEALLAVDTEEATKELRQVLEATPVLSLVHPSKLKVDKEGLRTAISGRKTKLRPAVPVAHHPAKARKHSVSYITKAIHSLPVVALKFIFVGGSREEKPGQYGVGHMFGRLWTSGTPSFKALQITQTLESLGASLHGFCGRNTSGIAIEFLSKHWPVIKPLLTEVLLSPVFPEEELNTERELVLHEILSERDTPGQICHINFARGMYGDHPYGRSALGLAEDVKRFSRADIEAFYQGQVHQGRLVVSSVGSFSPSHWIDELAALCERLPSGKTNNPKPWPVKAPESLQILFEKKEPLFQSHVMAGFLGTTITEPDRYALKLLSSALAGQGGRLFLELRDKQSLAYTVAPLTSDGPERGVFAFYMGCAPEKLPKALSGIRSEIEKVLEKPLSPSELARAKEYWLGRFELEMQRYGAQAMLYGLDEAYGLGYDHFLKVPAIVHGLSAKDIQQAARKYLQLEKAVISIVHNTELDLELVKSCWSKRSPGKIFESFRAPDVQPR